MGTRPKKRWSFRRPIRADTTHLGCVSVCGVDLAASARFVWFGHLFPLNSRTVERACGPVRSEVLARAVGDFDVCEQGCCSFSYCSPPRFSSASGPSSFSKARPVGNPALLRLMLLAEARPGEARRNLAPWSAEVESTRVFLVNTRTSGVEAFLARSTHLGCRLLFRGDPRFGDGLSRLTGIAFQDPCGGSVWALDGKCIGGPCPRALDCYSVDVQGKLAEIDVNRLLKGPHV